jgi:hypothetical protein
MKHLLAFLPILLASACQSGMEQAPTAQNTEAEDRAEILRLHDLQRQFHFEKRAEAFDAQLSDDFISVNRGEIKALSRPDNIARLNNYFGSVEFEKWDDLTPPLIRFSGDRSLAYTIVHKEVTVTYPGDNGDTIKATTEFAWLAVYRRHPEGWKIDAVASTNK